MHRYFESSNENSRIELAIDGVYMICKLNYNISSNEKKKTYGLPKMPWKYKYCGSVRIWKKNTESQILFIFFFWWQFSTFVNGLVSLFYQIIITKWGKENRKWVYQLYSEDLYKQTFWIWLIYPFPIIKPL